MRLAEQLAEKAFKEKRRIEWKEVSEATGLHRTTLFRMLNTPAYNATTENLDHLCRFFNCGVGDTHHISQKRGNGQLRREIWVDAQDQVTRYNLAYINHALHGADNGRVVGYDNHHGYHHDFGVVAAVEFTSFDDIEDQFQIDWTALRGKA
ncbi:helix-turn-helix transcriptional regulator [Rhodoferax sp. U2-2l]|uniref:helix-turn-helix domain-containing protein n=1 Tax=Rhodoferax sp. U2-2l TaxID=2884000 RepID=UPI001D09B91E|nr:helix-turn-helix transcriptional regulator [Rhodoferax sp. U2-2l]MCB8745433.1 helix-turn-helix transcriptional regulator [Rhodoferax sp. U2-2l]